MSASLLTRIVPLVFAFSLTGCRLLLVVPEGGKVMSQSGAIQCAATQSCPIEVTDTTFNETFVAVPDTGYIFKGWSNQHLHFCRKVTNACALATSSLATNSAQLAVLASDQVFYLSPRFERGFDSNIGLWQGNWQDTTSGKEGPLSLRLAKVGKNKIKVTLDLKGSVPALINSDLITIVAIQKPNGNLTYRGDAEVGGVRQKVGFSHSKAGQVSLSVSSKTQSISVDGALRGGVLFLNYSLEMSSPTVFSRGTVTAYSS